METAVTYCDHLVKSLPGPVRLHRSSYHDDPLVKALFLSPDEMENILQNARNTEIPGTGQEIFALLTMSKTEKTVYGHKQQGEMTLRDVAMQAVTFIDHRVVAPTADLQATETQLQQRSLEILASVAMEKIASFRANLAELRERRARLSSMHRILSGKRCTFEIFAQPEQENAKKIEELKALLSETDKEIELARKEIDTPDDTLGHLVRLMGSAADILVLRQPSLRLNWMNVIVEEGEEDEFHPDQSCRIDLEPGITALSCPGAFRSVEKSLPCNSVRGNGPAGSAIHRRFTFRPDSLSNRCDLS